MMTYKIWDADTSALIATIEGERLTRVVLTELLGSDLKADDVLNDVTPDSLALNYGGYTVLAEDSDELTYTVELSMSITRDSDDPLTPVEAVRVFRDEVMEANWIYRVGMPDGSSVRVDSATREVLP